MDNILPTSSSSSQEEVIVEDALLKDSSEEFTDFTDIKIIENPEYSPGKRKYTYSITRDDSEEEIHKLFNKKLTVSVRPLDLENISKYNTQSSSSELDSDENMPASSKSKSNRRSTTKDKTSPRKLRARTPSLKALEVFGVDLTPTPPRKQRNRTASHPAIDTDNTPPKKLRARTPSLKALETFSIDTTLLSPSPQSAVRKSGRKSIPTRRFTLTDEPKNTKTPKTSKTTDQLTDDDYSDVEVTNDRPSSALFDNEDNVGKQLYSFKTPKKRDGMAILALNTPKTPKTPQTPKSRGARLQSCGTPKSSAAHDFRTPHRTRKLIRKELQKISRADSDADFTNDEDSDYEINEELSEDDNSENEESEEIASSPECKRTNKKFVPTASNNNRKLRGRKEADVVPKSDGYFSNQSKKKSLTSDHTLDRLKTPRLEYDRLFALLADMKVSEEHSTSMKEMFNDHRNHFRKWLHLFKNGFNVLLHGFGSKRSLLDTFHHDMLDDEDVLVVNGFFPSLTIKDILENITNELLEITVSSRNQHEVVNAIEHKLKQDADIQLFIIIHNIDGILLRNHNAQLILSRLARIPNIYLIASMDHINLPNVWDNTILINYNFISFDCTTMLPYTAETAFENSMLVQNSGGLALSSMKNVFTALTSNSRGIYLVIVKNQLANKKDSNFQGISFRELYRKCREQFLVSSDISLRTQLTEFLDHHLVKEKRTSDGTEHLIIPIASTLLQQFLDQQEEE